MNTALPPALLRFLIPTVWFLGSYILGSIPEAWLLARWITGRDLRQMGSGNVGVMNTALSVARWAGLLVFLTEIAKGLLSVIVPRLLSGSDKIISLCVIAVVIGTRWSIWLRFKGGRGNTAGMSAFLLISIPTLGIALVLWVLARLVLKRSFIATRVTILSLPLIFGVVTRSWWFVLTGLVLCAIYLGAQQPESDDHRIIQQYWSSFWSFITSPPRRGK